MSGLMKFRRVSSGRINKLDLTLAVVGRGAGFQPAGSAGWKPGPRKKTVFAAPRDGTMIVARRLGESQQHAEWTPQQRRALFPPTGPRTLRWRADGGGAPATFRRSARGVRFRGAAPAPRSARAR